MYDLLQLAFVLWLFCGMIGAVMMFAYLQKTEEVEGFMLHLLATVFCAVHGVVMGPILLGILLGEMYIATVAPTSPKVTLQEST